MADATPRAALIVRYTREELAQMRERGEDRTDWTRVDATSPEEIERQAAEDGTPADWAATVQPGLPPSPETKRQVTLRLDPEVLDYFKSTGRGWQTRINAVLRHFVAHRGR